jgi:hypothetical protein
MDNIFETNKFIEKNYKNLSYLDEYFGSLLMMIVFGILVGLVFLYSFLSQYKTEIQQNWQTEKCKLSIIPFAGLINTPEGEDWVQYTSDNFQNCLYNVQSSIAGNAFMPITFITNLIAKTVGDLFNALQAIRQMMYKVRGSIKDYTKNVMARLLNIMIPLQRIMIAMKNFMAQAQGVLTSGLYMGLGSYMTLQSLTGAIVEFIIIILLILVAIIIALWILPFTWGFAAVMTVVFLSIAIPVAIIVAFMAEYLHVTPSTGIPTVKCFDEDTELLLKNNKSIKIKEINEGDILMNGDVITAIIKVTSKNSTMYKLNNIMVSDSHLVHYKNQIIKVSQHPNAFKIKEYTKPFLYCINTSSKEIYLNNTRFLDWDDMNFFNFEKIKKVLKTFKTETLHYFFDGGFREDTIIKTINRGKINIKDIEIGDILDENENRVYGIVKINISKRDSYEEIHLGNNENIKYIGILNNISPFKIKTSSFNIENQYKFYHILTTKGNFYVQNILFYDYNSGVNLLLDK